MFSDVGQRMTQVGTKLAPLKWKDKKVGTSGQELGGSGGVLSQLCDGGRFRWKV